MWGINIKFLELLKDMETSFIYIQISWRNLYRRRKIYDFTHRPFLFFSI